MRIAIEPIEKDAGEWSPFVALEHNPNAADCLTPAGYEASLVCLTFRTMKLQKILNTQTKNAYFNAKRHSLTNEWNKLNLRRCVIFSSKFTLRSKSTFAGSMMACLVNRRLIEQG